MSSREIAEYTGKEPKNVLADIRTMLYDLGLTWADFSAYVQIPGPNGASRASPIFNLPKDLTITLVSGYSAPMRHAIVKRWMELEAQAPATPKVTSPQSNGMAESFVKTLKRDYARLAHRPDSQTVMAQLQEWFDDYNSYHPHSALGYLPPKLFRANRAVN